MEYLLHSYPNFVRVDTMPIEGGMENKVCEWMEGRSIYIDS